MATDPGHAVCGPPVLRLATRGSRLALLQAEEVAEALGRLSPAPRVELLTVLTRGDLRRDLPLTELSGPDGLFTHGVEAELLAGRAELAVHSLKDLPSADDPRLPLAAFLTRADARDVLVARRPGGLVDLPPGAVVGTSSLRREAQLRAIRPDLTVISIRGNVDTRLRKLEQGEFDAVVLAAAGLARLGRLDVVSEYLDPARFTPAVGQGALAAQCRADDACTLALLEQIDHPPTRVAVTAERAFLQAIGGGCRLPVGAYARLEAGRLTLSAFVGSRDGGSSSQIALSGSPDHPVALGQEAAARLLERVGPTMLAEVRGG